MSVIHGPLAPARRWIHQQWLTMTGRRWRRACDLTREGDSWIPHCRRGSIASVPPARIAKVEAFTGFEYLVVASRVRAERGHRPQVPAPPVGGGQGLHAVGEGTQELLLPCASFVGGLRGTAAGAGRGGHQVVSPSVASPGSVNTQEVPTNVSPESDGQGRPPAPLPVGPATRSRGAGRSGQRLSCRRPW